ncbi:MAG: hypothetical protein J7M26_08905 [Armatimonadetes bacterium]|nr:hypothetical protein [Armatimonadota bacterium]
MRAISVAVVLGLVVVGACADLPGETIAVKNAGFEEVDAAGRPVGWSCSPEVYQVDDQVKHSGQRSLRFHNTDPGRYELASQTVPLEPGKMYEFSVWVKTQGLKGKDSGATLCLEWWGEGGKYLGGSYPRGVKGDTDWTLVQGISARIPAEAKRCGLVVYCRQGMTGTAWFDDVSIKRAFADPLDAILMQPNYRGRLGSKPRVQVDVRLDLTDLSEKPEELAVVVTVADQAGKVVGQISVTPAANSQPVIALPEDLAPGRYEVKVKLVRSADARVLSSRSFKVVKPDPAAPQPRVWVDEHNRLIVDGKPFLPLGMYSNMGLMKEDVLREYSQSAFNCLMPYGTPTREALDLAQKYGLKVIASIKDSYSGSTWCPKEIKTPADERPWLEGVINGLKDHPALLAWYINDELPLTMLDRLTAHRDWVEELDPDHPSWVVLYQVTEVRKYLPTFDVIGTDPYPIPGHPSRAAQWTGLTRAGVAGSRAVWMVPQVFNWRCYHKEGRGRTPTFDEMRSMAWQCLCEGANGLVFYSFFDIRRDTDTPFEVQWQRVKRMAEEIKQWEPALLSADKPAPVRARGSHVHWMVKALQGKTYVFAVNDDYQPHTVTFKLPSWGAGLRRLSDETLLPAGGNDRVSDKLRGLDMQVYELAGE